MYCPTHEIVPVPAEELPVLLPDDVEFRRQASPHFASTRGSCDDLSHLR